MMRLFLAGLFGACFCVDASAQLYTCTTSNYGKSCGPVLDAAVKPQGNTHKIKLTVTKTSNDSKLILLVGADTLDLPLSVFFANTGMDCRLLLFPVFIQKHNVKRGNVTTFGRALPSTAFGVGHVQFLEMKSNGRVLATNGITLDCK